MQRAFTFFQLMVVLAIIALIAVLTMPVIASAKERAKVTTCLSRLAQWSAAISVYRQVYDGDGKYGAAAEMGLPQNLYPVEELLSWPKGVTHCTGVSAEGYERPILTVYWSNSETWRRYSEEYRAESILIGDPNHNAGLPVGSPFMLTTGLGLYEGGSVKQIRRRGNLRIHRFWN